MGLIQRIGGRIALPGGGGTDTSDATAAAANIESGYTAYGSAGTKLTGTLWNYTPPMSQFNGSKVYTASYTSSGNKITATIRFNRPSFSGGTTECLFRAEDSSDNQRLGIRIYASDHSTDGRRNKVKVNVQNSSATEICGLFSSSNLADGADHLLFFEFDGDLGTAVFRVDGADEDDTENAERTAPTTGTLGSGADSAFHVGANNGFASNQQFNGQIGMVGMRDASGLDYSDFGTGTNPVALDESGWAEWGSQPLFWNEYGQMVNNKGSAGAMPAIDGSTSPISSTNIPIADY